MRGKNKGRIIEVEILHLNEKGNGVAEFVVGDGTTRKVEIPFCLPGERIQAKIETRRHRIYTASLQSILIPSPFRVAPLCKHFTVCGGCRWQHIDYSQQLAIKEETTRASFEHLLNSNVELCPIIPSDFQWQYRNKMEYTFNTNKKGEQFLGLIMGSSHGHVLNLTECHLVDPWFSETLSAIREWWQTSNLESYYSSKDEGSLRTLTLREGKRTGDRMVVLTVSGNPHYALHRSHIDNFVKTVRQIAEPKKGNGRLSVFLRIQQIGKGMATNFYEMHLYGQDHLREQLLVHTNKNEAPFPLTFQIGPAAFFQPNTFQAERIFSLALQMAKLNKNSVLYDLYCGTGAIGLYAAKNAKQVVGIEISPESADNARTNVSLNKIKNTSIYCGAVRHVRDVMADGEHPKPDIVVIDPPRAGLDPNALEQIMMLDAKYVIYASCNVKTQVMNVESLLTMGYQLRMIQPIDQFPQTAHFENIVLLEKISN